MKEFVEILKTEIDQKMKALERCNISEIEKVTKALDIWGNGCVKLKKFTITYQFIDEKEEIKFFKETKPNLFSQLIYYRKLYNIELNRPVACTIAQKKYLRAEQASIENYASKRLDFIRYYRSGSTFFDHLCFLRGKKNNEQFLETFYYELDPLFSTNFDFKVTKILAHEKLSVYLANELNKLESHSLSISEPVLNQPRLTWLGSKSDLIELIYALDCKKTFGKIPLRQLADYFEKVFNISLDSNLSRAFSDLKIRNHPTSFLDRLKRGLVKRMEIINNTKRYGLE